MATNQDFVLWHNWGGWCWHHGGSRLPWVGGMRSEETLFLWLPSGWMRRVSPGLVGTALGPLLCPWAFHGKLVTLALASC